MSLGRLLMWAVALVLLIQFLTQGIGPGHVAAAAILFFWGLMVYVGLSLYRSIESLENKLRQGIPPEEAEEGEGEPDPTREVLGRRIFPTVPIRHALSWPLKRASRSVGTLAGQPIPAWIITPDGRKGEYEGVSPVKVPAGCSCLELPERHELILPPGLVYTLHTLGAPGNHPSSPNPAHTLKI